MRDDLLSGSYCSEGMGGYCSEVIGGICCMVHIIKR